MEQRQRVQQQQVFRHRLAEPKSRIEQDFFARDPCRQRRIAPRGQPIEHVEHHIAIAGAAVQILALTRRVHQHHRRAAACGKFQAARIVAQSRNVVDQMRARAQRRLHHRRAPGVRTDRRASRSQPFDRRDHAFKLVAFPHRRCARTGAFAAHIDDRRARLKHGRGVGIGHIGIVHELPAIGEAVGRHVEDAHDLRLIEPDRARAALQRGVRAGEIVELLAHGIGQA